MSQAPIKTPDTMDSGAKSLPSGSAQAGGGQELPSGVTCICSQWCQAPQGRNQITLFLKHLKVGGGTSFGPHWPDTHVSAE